jgi:hypothetical protein
VRTRFGLFYLLALGNAACGTGTGTGPALKLNYIETREPPRNLSLHAPEQVELFMAGKPNRPFVEVGMIESQQEESTSEDGAQELVAKMRRFAGERGCDALVILGDNDATGVSGTQFVTASYTLKGYRGSCLVYTAAPAPAPAAVGCIPGSTQLCYGPGGCRGGQRCTADGMSYTLCDCGNSPAADAAN